MSKDKQEHDQDSSLDIKRMSTLLLSGATMLADSCPDCNVPLFKKDENAFCPKCNRKAIYVSSDEEARKIEHSQSFSETIELLQDMVIGKLNFLAQKLAASETFEEMDTIIRLIDIMLELIVKITRIK
jgi:UPF0148 protein